MNDSHALTVDEAGDGRPALLIHGSGGPMTIAAIGGHLAKTMHTITPTLPGWNGTEPPDDIRELPTSPRSCCMTSRSEISAVNRAVGIGRLEEFCGYVWSIARADSAVSAVAAHAPIPGTKRVARVEENTAADGIELSAEQIARLDDLTPAVGERHEEASMANIDR